MVRLLTPVKQLSGVGPATATKLSRLGIRTALDLLSHFPIRHDDLRRVTLIRQLKLNEPAVVRGKLQLLTSRRGFRRRRMSITEALLQDATGAVRLVWFNQPYLATSFKPGEELFVVGKLTSGSYGTQMQSPLVERVSDRKLLAGRILPVYRSTDGLTQRQLRLLTQSVMSLSSGVREWLPEPVVKRERLLGLPTAIRQIHFPASLQQLSRARERLTFGELLIFSLSLMQDERLRARNASLPIPFNEAATRTFVRSLPFTLTTDQRKAAWEILQDLTKPMPMNRLLEGDVGSGKTVVAAIAMRNVAAHGMQSAMLAPTEILARQHYESLKATLRGSTDVALLTASQRDLLSTVAPSKKEILKRLEQGSLNIIVGTHALLSERVRFSKLGLIVIDEQHRFGVEQRHALQLKGDAGTVPHLLSMTATPIPRTLALALYGDLKISQLRELPPGRIPIATTVVPPERDDAAFAQIREQVKGGNQAFVVCPLIEENDVLGVAAATTEYERLNVGPLAGLRLGLLHGKLPSKKKQRALDDFAAGRTDVLVATPVVEVGVDVPDATVMVIEGAERFGLAQLHQLRGRVGRSSKPSQCFLITESGSVDVLDRLQLVARSHDGFALAEADLNRRGPGDLYGIRQSGLPEFKMASFTDLKLMKRAQALAHELLAQDINLSAYPLLQRKTQAFFKTIHPE